jgi:predicted DNA-binding protein
MKDAKNLHVPLPGELHSALRDAAARLGKPATTVAREAIERYVLELRKQTIDLAIEAWAIEVAGSELDLDPMLESATVE